MKGEKSHHESKTTDAQALSAEFDAVNAATAGIDLIQKQYDDGAAALISASILYS